MWPRNASSLMQPSQTTWCGPSRNNKEKREKRGTPRTGNVDGRRDKEEIEAQRLWGMLYADDAGMVSRSPERLERMITVIVTA